MTQFDGKSIPVVKTPLATIGLPTGVPVYGFHRATRVKRGGQRAADNTHNVNIKSLDRVVVALILHFAAEPKSRFMELKILRDEDDNSDFSDDYDDDYDE